ncbi:MAG: N-acetylmuramoyl-L-alanine amidase [Bacteroidales bacterium]|nr:N-acetylmuramoyl-L-alanine amidase [Bacteroidales bacterium]
MKHTISLLAAGLLAVFPASAQHLSLSTVAIDAGHGGKDPGAVSRDGKTYEKDLTLDIALKLAKRIGEECPGVKVVLTRDRDRTLALNDRAVIANKASADLFISIHINSTTGTGPNGYSMHVLGKSKNKNRDLFAYNQDVCKRENAVVLLEDDYSTKYQGFDPNDPESFIFLQLMQNSHLEQSLNFAQTVSSYLKGGPVKADRGIWQDPLLVLWKVAMPAVLIELGFISNSTDLAALRLESNRDRFADAICKAFKLYKNQYDRTLSLERGDSDAKPGKADASGKAQQSAGGGAASSGMSSSGGSASQSGKAASSGGGQQTSQAGGQKDSSAGGQQSSSAGAQKAGGRWGVQIFVSSKVFDLKDKAVLGYEPVVVEAGNLRKYVIGVSGAKAEAESKLPAIRKKYPDAFLVPLQGR